MYLEKNLQFLRGKMKIQKIIPIVILVFIFIAGVLWRLDEAFYANRVQTLEFQLRTQVTALSQNFQSDVQFWQHVPVKDIKSWPQWQASAEMGAIDETFAWRDSQWGPLTKKEALIKKLKSLVPPSGSRSNVIYDVFFDLDQKPRAFVWVRQDNRTYMVVTPFNTWQSWVETFRGPGAEIFVMNTAGVSLAHGQRDYIGQKATEHPVFKELAQRPELQQFIQTMRFQDKKIYSVVAEKVPNSNLIIVSASPVSEALAGRAPLRWQIITLGLGVLCLLVGYVVFGMSDKPVPKPGARLPKPQAKAAILADNRRDDPSSDDKMKVYKSIAGAVGHELRAPLSSILAFAQTISGEGSLSGSAETSMHSLIRETREARSILDKILGFSGHSIKEKMEMKLETPVRKAIKKLDGYLMAKGVELKTQIEDPSLISMDPDSLMKAIENIIMNAVEAMDRQLEKKLSITVTQAGEQSILAIDDNGQGMDNLTVESAKDPFFTTRSFAHHLGLGLAESDGIFREHQAQIKIQSQVGKGTRVEVHFKSKMTVTQTPQLPPLPPPPPPANLPPAHLPPPPPPQPLKFRSPPQSLAMNKPQAPEEPENIDELFEFESEGLQSPPPPPGKVSAEEIKSRLENMQPPESFSTPPLPPAVPKPDIQIVKTKKPLEEYKVPVRRPGSRSS